ncbi:MAG: hypothetical protein M5U26_01355 [Planctomycetota bacterium]|nr:hypothetical protein [Planctomycetota bacterium]
MTRPTLRLHLSTCLVLAFAAGALLFWNLAPYYSDAPLEPGDNPALRPNPPPGSVDLELFFHDSYITVAWWVPPAGRAAASLSLLALAGLLSERLARRKKRTAGRDSA